LRHGDRPLARLLGLHPILRQGLDLLALLRGEDLADRLEIALVKVMTLVAQLLAPGLEGAVNLLDLLALLLGQPELIGRRLQLLRDRLLQQVDFGTNLMRLLSPRHGWQGGHDRDQSAPDRNSTT